LDTQSLKSWHVREEEEAAAASNLHKKRSKLLQSFKLWLGLVKKYGLGFFSSSFFLFLGFFGAEIYG
jgi:hypothetical protein